MQSEPIKTPSRGQGRNPQSLAVLELPDALLRLETLSEVSGLSVPTLYRKAAAGELELIKIGKRCTRVRSSAARAFIHALGQAA